jgi:hypothetical protein
MVSKDKGLSQLNVYGSFLLIFAQGLFRTTKLSDCIAVALYARNAPTICREKTTSHLGYYAAHYKHVYAFSRKMMGVSGAQADGSKFGKDSA